MKGVAVLGRGNACVHGDYEGLYFLDYDSIRAYEEDDDGNEILDEMGYPIPDDDLSSVYLEDFEREFKSDFISMFPSFSKCDVWVDSGAHAVLENELFYIAFEDNEWSLAIELLQKESDSYNVGSLAGLQAKHYVNYLAGIRACMFNQVSEIGTYAGPWTSGRLKREDVQ